MPDATVDAYDWGDVAIIGKVCTAFDFRDPYGCPPGQNVRGLQVDEVVSGMSITTLDDGSFGLGATPPGPAVLRVTGDAGGVRRASVQLVPLVGGRARDVITPTVTDMVWTQFSSYLNATDDPALGTIIIKLVVGTVAAQGYHTLSLPAGTTGPVFYDAGGAFDWSMTNGTQDHGVVIVVGVPPGSADIQLRDIVHGTVLSIAGLPVEPGALTFERVDLATM